MKKELENKFPSELRLDRNSKNWVVIATGRARRPDSFKKDKGKKNGTLKKDCPFCDSSKLENPILFYNQGKEISFQKGDKIPKKWTTMVLPNKYPAFRPSVELNRRMNNGLFETMNAVGFHEVVITKNHHKSLALFSLEQVKEVFEVYLKRYSQLIKEKIVNYVAIFHNHGSKAGASIDHPHSQIIGIPLIDIDLEGALKKAKKYQESGECLYCQMNKWERKEKKRVVYENKDFIAICPFVSKAAFQVIISPKKHQSFFEKITEKEKTSLADAFRIVLAKLYKGLGDPPYNFYLHSAPSDGQDHSYYHWHWTILPKTSVWAGFELGVGIEISTIEPEKAAEYLRQQKV